MKILFVAPASDFTRQIDAALGAQGHTVIFIDDRLDYGLPVSMRSWRWLWRVSRRIPWLRQRSNHALQVHIVHTVVRERPGLLLSTKGMNIQASTFAALRRMHIPMAVWFAENAANEPYASWVRTIGPLWNYFFSFDSAIYEQMPQHSHARVHVLPFGVDPETFAGGVVTDEDRSRYTCDVCFIGAPYPDRVALLEKVADRNLRIWGWSAWRKTPLKKFWHGPLNAQESAKAYQLAKICVNTNIRPLPKGVNLKTFEIAAAGGFELTDHPADLDASFVVGREVEVFENESQFHQKVLYWLEHDQERQAIAVAARARVLKDHTLNARVRTLLKTIGV